MISLTVVNGMITVLTCQSPPPSPQYHTLGTTFTTYLTQHLLHTLDATFTTYSRCDIYYILSMQHLLHTQRDIYYTLSTRHLLHTLNETFTTHSQRDIYYTLTMRHLLHTLNATFTYSRCNIYILSMQHLNTQQKIPRIVITCTKRTKQTEIKIKIVSNKT